MLIFTVPAFMLAAGFCVEFGGRNYFITNKNTSVFNAVVVTLLPVDDPAQDPIVFQLNPDTIVDCNIPLA